MFDTILVFAVMVLMIMCVRCHFALTVIFFFVVRLTDILANDAMFVVIVNVMAAIFVAFHLINGDPAFELCRH
jgi:hypothetical protein